MRLFNQQICSRLKQLCVLVLVAGFGLRAQDSVRHLDPLSGRIDGRLIASMHALDDGLASEPALTSGLRQSFARVLPPAAPGMLPVTLDVLHLNDEKLQQISAAGAVVTHSSAAWNSVTAMANLETLGALLKIDGVRSVQVPRKAISRQSGSTPNEGDAGMKTDQLRAQLGFTGKGSKIGVLSNYINQSGLGPGNTTTDPANPNYFFLAGLTDQTSGDLPPSIQVLDFGPAVGPLDVVTAEGAAMMELIYDVAPGASFAFASSLSDQIIMAGNIQKLQQVGCNIIVDDQSYAEEPFFQDGPIAQQIGVGFAAGILHVSAAGNEGDQGIQALHSPVTPGAAPDKGNTPSGNFFHNWGLGGVGLAQGFLPITIPAGGSVKIVVQWNQPYATLNLGPGATDDLNTFLYTSADPTSAVVPNGSSTDPQGLDPNTGIVGPFGDPREVIDYTNGDLANPVTLYFAVDHVSGSGSAFSANVLMRVVFISDQQLTFPSGGVGAMTAFGHVASPGTISVGAVNYAQITGAPSGINAEANSARGGIGASGVPYYFDTTGKPLSGAPVKRDCPDLAAPDAVSISFSLDGISAPKFFGTSAAAANAAAAAALLYEQVPLASSAQMRQLLKDSALDIAAPGPDDRTGNGLVDALNASTLAPRVTKNPTDVTTNKGTSGSFSVTASGSPVLTYQWQKGATGIVFVDIAGATAPRLL